MSDRAGKPHELSGEAEPLPFIRIVRVDQLKEGEERVIEAGPAERADIAALLDLVALDRLSFAGRFAPRGQGRLALRGRLQAAVTQTCVVSLEPVPGVIDAEVEMEFWPLAQIEQRAESLEEAASQGTLDWPEPIREGRIDLGRVIYEALATALDPYPKREGARFAWSNGDEESAVEGQDIGPFAALVRLKQR
jgi:hypothetical protein